MNQHPLRIDIVRGHGRLKRWHYRVVANNDEIVLASENYFSKWNAKRAAYKYAKDAGITTVRVEP